LPTALGVDSLLVGAPRLNDAGSVLAFGGGFKRGFLYGKTADERPCRTIENPVTIEDLHATIYRALGIPPDLAYVVEKRPVYVTRDGKGRPIADLLRPQFRRREDDI